MEIVHDRERERYSKHISRTFSKGIYYLEVNANHPDYILRTRELPVPPYDDPAQAVEAGMHYIINVGDAWFAQIPREGNIYVRSNNLHDTATRCTACHPSSFSTESNLVAHRNGYPIRSKSNFQYVIDRLYNSITPLYGNQGLYWQRFIAIPLQAQGKQGGILLDFEREVSQSQTKTIERFGPFLERAWESRRDLPKDELNGVIPLDSKFGFAWRDWRVLDELGVRTGQARYTKAAAQIASILGDRAADHRIETLQDRIHRLYAWWLIDKAKFANKIKRETGALIRFQNPDGGWHEVDYRSRTECGLYDRPARLDAAPHRPAARPSGCGQRHCATCCLSSRTSAAGSRRQLTRTSAPRCARRDTPSWPWPKRIPGPRLRDGAGATATMARPGCPGPIPWSTRSTTWRTSGTCPRRNGRDSRKPSSRCCNIPSRWSAQRRRPAWAGWVGRNPSTSLVERLGDPSKIVWRAAAWALRRLGNQGIGQDAILSALKSPDPRIRRGATRIFAYQFHGMDERPRAGRTAIRAEPGPRSLDASPGDPDPAPVVLSHEGRGLRPPDRRDVPRADVPGRRRPVVRKNLSEGLYIMLDENLGGGVSLQKNIAELPEAMRAGILDARKAFERDVLLTPVLSRAETRRQPPAPGYSRRSTGRSSRGGSMLASRRA